MKIAVLGAGAMGCLYGESLAEVGNEVSFIDVVPRQVDAINQRGIKLTTNKKGTRIIQVKAYFAEEINDKFDLLILFTKTIHSKTALESVKHILTKDITVLTMQNGLGNKEVIEEFVNESQIIIGMTGFPADNKGPAEVESHGSSFTGIIDANGTITQRTIEIGNEITKAGLNCRVTEEVFQFIWEKVSFNAAVNALTTVTQLKQGHMVDNGGRNLAYKVAKEGIEVANKKGIPASYDRVKEMLDHAFVDHYNHKPSMLQDFLAEKKTEVEFINGAIAAQARAVGITAPINETLYEIISILQNTYSLRIRE